MSLTVLDLHLDGELYSTALTHLPMNNRADDRLLVVIFRQPLADSSVWK